MQGKYTITIKDLNICVNNTLLKNNGGFFLEVCYYWSKGCEGDNEQPAEEEYFVIEEIKSFHLVEFFHGYTRTGLSIDCFTDWLQILDEEAIEYIYDKVYKELKEESNEQT